MVFFGSRIEGKACWDLWDERVRSEDSAPVFAPAPSLAHQR